MGAGALISVTERTKWETHGGGAHCTWDGSMYEWTINFMLIIIYQETARSRFQ